MSFADRIRLLIPVTVEETVGDATFKFYQCSPKTLAATATLVAKLAGSISMLFADKAGDSGHTVQDFSDPESGEFGQTTVINATPEPLVAQRAARRKQAIEDIISSLLVDEHREALIRLVINSLRDDFPRNQPVSVDDLATFDDMDMGPFSQFFVGMMRANAKVFGDLGKQLLERVQGTVVGAPSDEAEEAPAAEEPAG